MAIVSREIANFAYGNNANSLFQSFHKAQCMEKAENIDQLIDKIAEQLTMADHVYYDVVSLQYGAMFEDWLAEYGDYLDLTEEAFIEIPEEELSGWEREEVADLRKVVELPYCIDKPFSSETFQWMEEFTNLHANNPKFAYDAVNALSNRHPFRGFRVALDYNGLTADWYPFRDAKMEAYVRNEMSIHVSQISEDNQ